MYGIAKFSEHYVTADMKRKNIKTPSWFKCPTDTPEVVVLIHGHPDGLAHLGVWERLQCWAVRNWKTDGWFTTVTGPMSVREIALHTGLHGHEQVTQEAIARLIELGWVTEANPAGATERSSEGVECLQGVAACRNEELPAGRTLGPLTGNQPLESDGDRCDISSAGDCEDDVRLRAANGQPNGTLREEKRREEKKKEQAASKSPRRRSRIQWSDEDGWQGITEADRQTWLDAYAGIDIDCELAKMTAWLRANPSKANKKQWGRFVNGWLSRTQNQKVANARPVESTGWAAEAAQGM